LLILFTVPVCRSRLPFSLRLAYFERRPGITSVFASSSQPQSSKA
jgi:hypothetical protein